MRKIVVTTFLFFFFLSLPLLCSALCGVRVKFLVFIDKQEEKKKRKGTPEQFLNFFLSPFYWQ